MLLKRIHVTKRDLFYTDAKLFVDQKESDAVLDDIACMAGCTRTSLHVVASEKGIVVGRVRFRDDGDLIDCTRMGVGGKAIPPYIDRITDIQSDAEFVLLVEKDAAFMRLAEVGWRAHVPCSGHSLTHSHTLAHMMMPSQNHLQDRFYNKYPCIIITAKGQPDVATRLFLKKLKVTLKLPVFGLVDSDPYGTPPPPSAWAAAGIRPAHSHTQPTVVAAGLKILSVYMSGSKNMSYDSASLTTPDIKWLGVRPSDLERCAASSLHLLGLCCDSSLT